MGINITECLTAINCNIANRTKADISHIVIHFVGVGTGAIENCRYFAKTQVGASAHLFVGHKGEVCRSVADKDIAWHCGTTGTYYCAARNSNSIGIELCCYEASGRWCFYPETVRSAIELTREYMAKYAIPSSSVVRHYDVTRKICPEPFCNSAAGDAAWAEFKAKLGSGASAGVGADIHRNYLVRVTAATLNIRKGPGTHYASNGAITDKGSYTIVEEADGAGAKKWGRLKSGAGWISLDYTVR